MSCLGMVSLQTDLSVVSGLKRLSDPQSIIQMNIVSVS